MAKKDEEFNDLENQNDDLEINEDEVFDEKEVSEENAETEDVSEDEEESLEKRYMSLYAEYENFRKRSVKEKEQLYADAVADVSSNWLLLLDNIDRAISANQNVTADSLESVVQGVEMLGKQAQEIISKVGIEEITCSRGDAFDPNLHEAVMHVDDDELGEQQIASIFQKGYIYKNRVIRHAVVQVAN